MPSEIEHRESDAKGAPRPPRGQRAPRVLVALAMPVAALLLGAAVFAATLMLVAMFSDWRGQPAWIPAGVVGGIAAIISGVWLVRSTRRWPHDQVVVHEERIETIVHGGARIVFMHEIAGLQYIPDRSPERQRLIIHADGGPSIRLRGDEFDLDTLYELAREVAAGSIVDRVCATVERGGEAALIYEPVAWRVHRWAAIAAGVVLLAAGGAAGWWAAQGRDWLPLAVLAGAGLVVMIGALVRGRPFAPRGVVLSRSGIRAAGSDKQDAISWDAIAGVGSGPDFYVVKSGADSREIRLDYAANNAPFFLELIERLRVATLTATGETDADG